MQKKIYKEIIKRYIQAICPQKKAENFGWVERFLYLAPNYPELAADTLLRKELVGRLENVISEIIKHSKLEMNICRALTEVVLNLFGLESKRIGFTAPEKEKSIESIIRTLKAWEKSDEAGWKVIQTTIDYLLENWKKVLAGKSLTAELAKNIMVKLNYSNLVESFFLAAKSEIRGNVYYRMNDGGFSKFGNDSATGLRIVRHFDFVQVSSNPVIAARAYEEFPELWEDFGKIVEVNPEWQKYSQKYAEEITLFATINSILPNILVFRPLALLSDFHDGLVSYQLNPFLAENSKASLKDAEKICSILKDILYQYDKWLGWDAERWQGRPNIVFKVAASFPTAIEITKKLNEIGIGTNNTVTYSVSQEITLLLTEAEGMAKVLKKNVLPTQVYQTNMIGRTEDYLREAEAKRLVGKLSDEELGQLTKLVMEKIPVGKSRQEITEIICSKKYFKSLDDQRLAEALKKYHGEEVGNILKRLEGDIQYSGIFVTRRVYQIFFENKPKILEWLQKKFKLSEEQARIVFERIDLLPASKRRAQDTYLVLGTSNITNTEFPDQQLKVYAASKEANFNLEKYRQSIMAGIDSEIIKRLLEIEDFQKIFEATPELNKTLKEIGIEGDFGNRGMNPKEWQNYGAVQKTMQEFKNAYRDFQGRVLQFVKS